MAYEEIEYDMYGDPIYPDENSSLESEKVVDAFGVWRYSSAYA